MSLPLELVLQVVDASLSGANHNKMAHFEQLRLVSKAVKAQAHQTHPKGLSTLASRAASYLLDDLEYLDRDLGLASQLLRQTKELALEFPMAPKKRREYRNPTRIDCGEALDELHGLSLESLSSLRKLRVENSWNVQLIHLDLPSLSRLEIFSMVAADKNYKMQALRGFQLPPGIVSLELSRLAITGDELQLLNLSALYHLHTLKLDNNFLAAETIETIGLFRLRRLRHLDLSYNRLSDAIGAQLRQSGCSLETLNLSGNNLIDPGTVGVAANIRSITSLSVGSNPLRSLAFGLEQNTTLRELHLNVSTLSAPVVLQLSWQLARNSTLVKLGLSACTWKTRALQQLRLEKSTGLKLIRLTYTNIANEHVEPLLNSIEEHQLLDVCVDLGATITSYGSITRYGVPRVA